MRAEFFMDLCFIRGSAERTIDFAQKVEEQLEQLFADKAKWYLESKKEDHIDIVLAEVKGSGDWDKEEDIVNYIQENASDSFINWLQGYRIEIDIKGKHESCANCGKDNKELEVS